MEEKINIEANKDVAFKYLITKNKDFLKKIIEETTKIVVDEFIFLNNEMINERYNSKKKIVDCIIKSKGHIFNIEINTSSYKGLMIRNHAYVCDIFSDSINAGEDYYNVPKVVQINLCFGINNEEINTVYYTSNPKKPYDEIMAHYFMYVIDMDKLCELYYNNGDVHDYKYTNLLCIKDVNEYNDYVKGDDIMEKFNDNLKSFNKGEIKSFYEWISPEEDERKIHNSIKAEGYDEGIKDGIEKNIISSAKKLFKNKVSKETLTKEEIEEIVEANSDYKFDKDDKVVTKEETDK